MPSGSAWSKLLQQLLQPKLLQQLLQPGIDDAPRHESNYQQKCRPGWGRGCASARGPGTCGGKRQTLASRLSRIRLVCRRPSSMGSVLSRFSATSSTFNLARPSCHLSHHLDDQPAAGPAPPPRARESAHARCLRDGTSRWLDAGRALKDKGTRLSMRGARPGTAALVT
jgi:hypothetical protein